MWTGDRLLRFGIWVTAAGMLLTLIAMIPLVAPGVVFPSIWWFLAMVTGIGLAVIIAGFVVSGRERRRAVDHAIR